MKKLIILLSMLFLMTGCGIHVFNYNDMDVIIEQVLQQNIKLNNVMLEGYKYYIPHGVILEEKHDYNQVLSYNNNKYYLYVDIISYYYKNKVDHQMKKNVYFSKDISYGKKSGYIDIIENEDNFYIEAYYNYARVEAYVKKEDLHDSVINICYLLNSMVFNNKVIESMVGENKLNYSSEKFSLFDEEKDTSSFLQYVQEFDKYYDAEGELPTDDQINVDKSED